MAHLRCNAFKDNVKVTALSSTQNHFEYRLHVSYSLHKTRVDPGQVPVTWELMAHAKERPRHEDSILAVAYRQFVRWF
ncbi:hypothetical protein ScPMuIL_002945 [Solemya velum]